MKYVIYCAFTICLCSFASGIYAQQCAILSMDRIGGNKSEGISSPGIINYPNGEFSIMIGTNSTTGTINTACVQTTANGTGGGILQTYNNSYTQLIGAFCIPRSESFRGNSTFFFYPQDNGDTILIGVRETDSTSYDIGIERRLASGTVLWTKFYGGSASDGLAGIAQAADGGFFIASGTNSVDGDVGLHYGSTFYADTWVLRLDNNGDKLWSKVIGGSGTDLARDIKAAADGGCYIFGVTASDDIDATGNHGSSDLHIVKLDSLGHKQWHKCLGGSADDGCGYDLGIKVLPDNLGGFYVLNRTSSVDGDIHHRLPDETDFWLLHIDSMANILWETTFGGPGGQYPAAFCQATDGSFWMGGQLTDDGPGGMVDITYGRDDAWVVHADSLGNFINQVVMGTPSDEYLNVLHPLPDGTVVGAGRYNGRTLTGSPGFPTENEGQNDIFLAHLGPQTVSIQEPITQPVSWKLFPNPARQQVTLQIPDDNRSKYQITITDASGRKMYKNSFYSKITIPTKSWQPGLYLVRLQDSQGRTSTQKLYVQ